MGSDTDDADDDDGEEREDEEEQAPTIQPCQIPRPQCFSKSLFNLSASACAADLRSSFNKFLKVGVNLTVRRNTDTNSFHKLSGV